jgi:hypothetical protein
MLLSQKPKFAQVVQRILKNKVVIRSLFLFHDVKITSLKN